GRPAAARWRWPCWRRRPTGRPSCRGARGRGRRPRPPPRRGGGRLPRAPPRCWRRSRRAASPTRRSPSRSGATAGCCRPGPAPSPGLGSLFSGVPRVPPAQGAP
ncbi:unnamed protein product, partial [Prorocentrum cordatum]